MIVFTDPCYTKGHCVYFVPDDDAIATGHACAQKAGHCVTDEQALGSFKAVHWGETLDQVIEKMAMAMWKMWRHGGKTDVVVSVGWEHVDQEPWREQAKEALRALGVSPP